jgi:hypothetical protein
VTTVALPIISIHTYIIVLSRYLRKLKQNKHLSIATQHVDSKYKEHDVGCATKHVDMIKSSGTR